RRVACVPAPRVLVTKPSSSSERKASRRVARETPSSSASSGSAGSFAPGGRRPEAIRAAISSRTVNDSRFFTHTPLPRTEGSFVGQIASTPRAVPGIGGRVGGMFAVIAVGGPRLDMLGGSWDAWPLVGLAVVLWVGRRVLHIPWGAALLIAAAAGSLLVP